MFYPMAKKGDYSSLCELAKAVGVELPLLESYVSNARIEGSPLVVCDRIALGNPGNQACMVLQLHPSQDVTQWVGFFSESSENHRDIEQWIAANQAGFNCEMAIGTFEPRNVGHA